MLHSGCSALLGVNPNLKKEKNDRGNDTYLGFFGFV